MDWYPWGEEAFRRAKAEDKPILLSIGSVLAVVLFGAWISSLISDALMDISAFLD